MTRPTITLNGAKFVHRRETLPEDAAGYYQRFSKSLTLLDRDKRKIGVINRHGVLCCAKRLDDGRYWYSHADIEAIGRWDSFLRHHEEVKAALAITRCMAPQAAPRPHGQAPLTA